MDKLNISGYIGARPDELDKMLTDAGVGDNFTAEMMRDYLKQNADANELEIEVKSIGGDVVEGFEIYDLLQTEKRKGKKITTIGSQYDSIASIIFLAGDERKSRAGASPLIHNSWLNPESLGDIALNKETLREIADSNEESDFQILCEYLKVAGRDKMRMLQDLMRNEAKLTDQQLLELNFATEIIGKAEKADRPRALAVNSNTIKKFKSKSNTMAEQAPDQTEKLNALERGFDKLLNAIIGKQTTKKQNMLIPLENGETELYIFSEDGEVEGKKAVIAENGEPTETPAPAGPHKLKDGRIITVSEGGVIESVAEATAVTDEDEMKVAMEEKEAALKALEEEKEKMAADLQAQKAERELEKKQWAKDLQALKAEMAELKEVVPGDDPGKKTKPEPKLFAVNGKEKKWEEMTTAEKNFIQTKNALKKQ